MDSIDIWLLLVAAGLCLVLGALVFLIISEFRRIQTQRDAARLGKDTESFRRILQKWEPHVFGALRDGSQG